MVIALEGSFLTADQKQQVREAAYVTLVSLADDGVRWTWVEGWGPKWVERSLDLLQRAQAFHQPTRAFYFVRSECRRLQGDSAAAAEDDRRFKASAAQTAWDYFLPGHRAGWSGDIDEAIRSYKEALRLQPNHRNSLFFLAYRLMEDKINRRPEAIAYLTACIALRPDDDLAYGNRAYCYLALGQPDEAIADLRQALRNDPGRASTHLVFSAALLDLGKLGEAVAESREAIRLKPDYAEAHGNLGEALRGQGKLDEAIAAYREAIRLKPDLVGGHGNLGLALLERGRLEEALAECREDVRVQPDSSNAHENLGAAYYRAGDFKAAIAALEKSIQLDTKPIPYGVSGRPLGWFILSMAHWRLGHKHEARTWYDRAIAWMVKYQPKDVDVKWAHAEASAMLGLADLPGDVFARP
ncbi:MAG: tetratricopeptide repeat protein [Isosphaeraceae bacterium]